MIDNHPLMTGNARRHTKQRVCSDDGLAVADLHPTEVWRQGCELGAPPNLEQPIARILLLLPTPGYIHNNVDVTLGAAQNDGNNHTSIQSQQKRERQ